MKRKSIVILAALMLISPIASAAEPQSGDGDANTSVGTPDSTQDGTALTDALTVPAAAPRGPKELLQDYEADMAAITQKFSATLLLTAEAVARGELTSAQGQMISTEQYHIAQMQFDLLASWRAMLEHDLARVAVAAAQPTSDKPEESEIVVVSLPFSSFELNPEIAKYLNLSQAQETVIQQLMTRERRNLEPLMNQLRTGEQKLLTVDAEHASKKDIKVLADTQASLLAKLIVVNARMQSKIYNLLTPEQQRKLDDLKRSSESDQS
jgi:Spy/CpxP family protein refolding chaperone